MALFESYERRIGCSEKGDRPNEKNIYCFGEIL